MIQFFIPDRPGYSLEFRRIAKQLMSYSVGHSATTIRFTCAQTSILRRSLLPRLGLVLPEQQRVPQAVEM